MAKSAHPHRRDTLLCRNRRTGDFLFIDRQQRPTIGDLVAVLNGDTVRVEAYSGQRCLGLIVPAIELIQTEASVCLPH